MSCTKCDLYKNRINICIPGFGDIPNEVMFVGEAPGASEDAQCRPFVGAAGQILDHLMVTANLDRRDFFITNTVRCLDYYTNVKTEEGLWQPIGTLYRKVIEEKLE